MAIFFFAISIFTTLLATLLTPLPAARAATPPTTCNLEFEVKGRDIQFLVGYSKLKGRGYIWCIDSAGRRAELPIKVTIGTPVFFPRIAFAPSLTVRGVATGITILKGGPQAILGKYDTVDLRIAIGAGFGTSLALVRQDITGQGDGPSFTLGLQDVEGFGIAVGGTIVTIEP